MSEDFLLNSKVATKPRVDIESFHRKAYGEAVLVCQSVGIEEATPRVTSRRQHCQNILADNSSDYYKRTTTTPYLIISLVS